MTLMKVFTRLLQHEREITSLRVLGRDETYLHTFNKALVDVVGISMGRSMGLGRV